MLVLNLGCGSRTSPHCTNLDWSPYLRLKRNRVGSALAPMVLRGERRERFHAIDANVVVHDLRRPLPVPEASADAAYHSHVLEHFDRNWAARFLLEIHRVLRVGAVHRIVVPDFETACRQYLAHVDLCDRDPRVAADHDAYIGNIIEQMVRREAAGTGQQPRLRRLVENRLLGDARRRGETHQWMYDRINLSELLTETGFRNVTVRDYRSSSIPNWDDIKLDELDDGREYIPGSLYIEAVK